MTLRTCETTELKGPARAAGAAGARRSLFPAIAAAALLIALAAPLQAKIDLVTLPARDQTQVTIYNSEDLTLTRETRTLTFSKGVNQIQFSWANTLIDPTSLQLRFLKSPEAFEIQDITYPANTQNTLIWNVEATSDGSAPVEISYFTSGVTWQADYVAKANAKETAMTLESYVRVTNRSGEDFEQAQVRLVVGAINLVEKIAELARRGVVPYQDVERVREMAARKMMVADQVLPAAAPMALMSESRAAGVAMMEVKEVIKQAISEYQLYTVGGTEDLPDQWSKRLRSFVKDAVKIEVAYELDERKYGPQVIKFYKLKNDAEHGLGENPLPEGVYRVLREDGEGGLAWVGTHTEKYIPIGEKLEMRLGSDGLIALEAKQMDLRRHDIERDSWGNVTGWIITEDWELEIRNSKPEAAPIKIVRYFGGEWEIEPKHDTKTMKFRKKDAQSVEYETTLAPLSTTRIPYTISTRFGSRGTR